MPNVPESRTSTQGVKATVQPTKQATFDKLTKSQLIELLNGRVSKPLTPDGLYRCAVSVLGKWCDDVIKGGYASMYDLTTKLEALQNIYRQR